MSIHGPIADALTGLNIFICPPDRPGVPFLMLGVFTPAGIEKAHRNLTGFEQGFADLAVLYPRIELLRGRENWFIDGLKRHTDDHLTARAWTRSFATHAIQHLGMFCDIYPATHDDVIVHRI